MSYCTNRENERKKFNSENELKLKGYKNDGFGVFSRTSKYGCRDCRYVDEEGNIHDYDM